MINGQSKRYVRICAHFFYSRQNCVVIEVMRPILAGCMRIKGSWVAFYSNQGFDQKWYLFLLYQECITNMKMNS